MSRLLYQFCHICLKQLMEDYYNQLFPYAYNILGSVEDARDIVQDIILNYISVNKDHIKNKKGYLIKAVINQSINTKKKRQPVDKTKVWLPEPYATEKADDNINCEQIISYSILVLLEKLTPKERAVFILKEAFDYSHQEIAQSINISIANSRKLLSRGKVKLGSNKGNKITDKPSITISCLNNYVEIIKTGNVESLELLLSEEISLYADGGEDIKVVREFTIGKKAAINLLLYVFRTYQESQSIKIAEMNNQPALLFFQEEQLMNCQVFDIKNNRIQHIYSIVSPYKLKSVLANSSHFYL